uniref:Uncharacterized protein n=1 Tax=Avena sativa TaxID=4498 RepID=A0ACD5YCY0_AVESA
MLSTQRVESANHMLKTYVPRNSSMNRFVLQYNNLLFDRGVEEDREEHKTKQVHNLSKRMWPIQRHAAKIYTRNAYKLFTDEVDKVTYYRVFEIEEDSLYEVHHINAERRESWSRVVFKINVEKSHLRFDCECGLYTHFGILCCHALAVIVNLGISEIPKAHILKRWTRNARDVLPPHLVMYQKDTPAMHSKTFRHSLLYTHAMESVKMGDTNLDTFKVMMKHFAAGQKEVKAMIDAMGSLPVDDPIPNYDSSDAEWRRDRGVGYRSEPDIEMSGHMQYGVSGSSAGMTTAELSSIKALFVARKAGRPRLNRFLSPLEPKRKRKHSSSKPGYVRQTRFCSKCHCSGHKITNCPENPDAGKKKRKQARCSICGMTGHKSNQCLTKTPIIEDYEESSEDSTLTLCSFSSEDQVVPDSVSDFESGYLGDGEDSASSQDGGSFNGDIDDSVHAAGSFSDDQQIHQLLKEEVGDSDDKKRTSSVCADVVVLDGDQFSQAPATRCTEDDEDEVNSILQTPKRARIVL